MKVTGVRVEFMKRLNDGDYGHEQATVQYVVDLEEGESVDEAVREFLERGRAEVVEQLKASENWRIRAALAAPVENVAALGEPGEDDDGDDDDDGLEEFEEFF